MANYLIIGGDGKEYGPVMDADVRQWIGEGRLNAQSQAKSESDAEFRPLAQFPEFAGVLAAASAPETIAPLKTAADFLERDYELDIGGCVTRGYDLLKEHFSLLFFAALVVAAIEGAIGALGAIPFVGPIFSIANMVISGPLMGGVYLVFLRALRGEAAEVGDVFTGFSRCFGQLFLGKLIPSLLGGLCLLPVVVAGVILVAVPAATQHHAPDIHKLMALVPIALVCLIPVIYLQTCWAFTLPLIIDQGMDFGAAMKTSWKMVNKHWWQVFGVILVVGLVNMVGALLCLIGLLFTVPIGFAAMMYAYETIFGAKKN
jgi:uncharacterized membrane protein